MIGPFQGTNHVILNDLTTGPAELQAGLVAVLTEWYPSFVVVQFTSKGDVALSTLETSGVVRSV